jgi:hypothetical protein
MVSAYVREDIDDGTAGRGGATLSVGLNRGHSSPAGAAASFCL